MPAHPVRQPSCLTVLGHCGHQFLGLTVVIVPIYLVANNLTENVVEGSVDWRGDAQFPAGAGHGPIVIADLVFVPAVAQV